MLLKQSKRIEVRASIRGGESVCEIMGTLLVPLLS